MYPELSVVPASQKIRESTPTPLWRNIAEVVVVVELEEDVVVVELEVVLRLEVSPETRARTSR